MSLFSASDPYLIDIHSLSRSPGSSYSLRDRVKTPDRIGLDLIAVPCGAELDCDLQLQVIDAGILLSGIISTIAQGECARCLNPMDFPVEVQITELFNDEPEIIRSNEINSPHTHLSASASLKKTAKSQNKALIKPDDLEDELLYIHDGMINIEQSLIDAIALSLPLIPLCDEDCAGLCADCGLNLNTLTDQEDHKHDSFDPRFAKLQSLLSNFDSEKDNRMVPLSKDAHQSGE